jgi:hypothetical protein
MWQVEINLTFKEKEFEAVDLIDLAQDKIQWWVLLSAVINI